MTAQGSGAVAGRETVYGWRVYSSLGVADLEKVGASPKNDKAEDTVKRKPKKPVEYRGFERLLKQVIKAPPLRKMKRRESD